MDEIRDKNGKTEQEFLRDYDVTQYFRPSVTVDVVLYKKIRDGLRILFVKRGGHPFIGKYAFPGGFVDEGEPCETAAARELLEETHVSGIPFCQLVTVSTPNRDPRWRNITVVYAAELDRDITAVAGDDAAAAEWFDIHCAADGTLSFRDDGKSFTVKLDVKRDAFGDIDLNNTRITERGAVAFDHAKVVYYLYNKIFGQG
ncbi:MAG: NUDIX hydrolase [Clostridiales bacterium]|nr:NUDIX hydrolase [Clostridiales bacterium]